MAAPDPEQGNFKSVSKKNHIQKSKFLSVKRNIFKDKNKIRPMTETKKVVNSKVFPSFSKMFTKQKKKVSFQDNSQKENNELAGRDDKQIDSQTDPALDLVDNSSNKKQRVKPPIQQFTGESTTTKAVGKPVIPQGVSPAQPVLEINRDGVKRKALKGLRSNIPAKIMKVNRGEKRPPSSTWDNPERKKWKKHNIVRDAPSYDMWRL